MPLREVQIGQRNHAQLDQREKDHADEPQVFPLPITHEHRGQAHDHVFGDHEQVVREKLIPRPFPALLDGHLVPLEPMYRLPVDEQWRANKRPGTL